MKALGLPVSEKNNFEVCLLCSYVQNCDPRGGTSFDPGAYVPTCEGPQGDAEYQISKLYAFQFQKKRIFFCSCVPNCEP